MRKSLFGIYHPAHKISLLIFDVLAIVLAFFISSKVRLGITPNYLSFEFLSLCIIIVSSLFVGNGYTSSTIVSQPRLPLNTFFIAIASAIPATLFIYLIGPERFTFLFGRGIFPFAILIVGGLTMLDRIVLNYLFRDEGREQLVLIVGDIQSGGHFNTEIRKKSAANIRIEHSDSLSSIENPSEFNAIVITPSYRPDSNEQKLLIDARLSGTPIFSLSDFFESFLFVVPVNEINNDWFIRTEGFTMLHSTVSTRLKRAVDIGTAVLLLILSIPICLLTALLIKMVSHGPVLFLQTRVGLKGKPFTLYKFRTMKLGAESGGAQWAQTDDTRVILFGRFLRATRIDELPQCWNILKGEMSIIGPRPERPEFTDKLAQEIPYYELRHIIKPGLTGWAQVRYSYGASAEDAMRKLQYDLYYIKNQSLLLDLNIMIRTLFTVFQRSGR